MPETRVTALPWRSVFLGVILAGCQCLIGGNKALAAAILTRGPYLQRGGTTNIVVRWRTDSPTASSVRYGTNLDAATMEVTNSVVTTEHVVELFDLAPGTPYYYSVGTTDQRLAGGASFFFTTAPVISKPTKIWVIGDSGTRTPDQLAVRDAYKHFVGTERTDLWLMLGDNAYSLGFDPVYQAAVFNVYPDLLQTSVLWPAIGNHDLAYTDPAQTDFAFLHIFSLPTNGECGGVPSRSSRYYSFDYGNIHFVCLDSESSVRTPPSPMLDWLEQDLRANTKLWTIAYWHSPPYSRGGHDSDLNAEQWEMRQNAVPILENHGVDLVLCAHSHAYERTFLMDGNYGTAATYQMSMRINGGDGRVDGTGPYYKPEGLAHKGTVYVVAGSSGQIDGAGTLDHPAMFYSVSVLGSLVLDVNEGTLNARFLTSDGDVADHFTIIKGSDPRNLRLSGLTITNGSATISWPSLPGHTYTVYFSTNLNSENWAPISEPKAATAEMSTWTGNLPDGASKGFLRVSLQLD